MPIPATHAEIEQLYLSAELSHCRSMCITACQSGDGVTAFAAALTERYLLAGHSTLLVDLNLFRPAFSGLVFEHEETCWIEHSDTHQVFAGLPVPSDRATQLAYKDPSQLKQAVSQWLEVYDRVIIDTSPLLQINQGNIPAQSVAAACDQTLLVVMAGKTSHNQVEQAISLLSYPDITLSGTVLNLKNQPTLAQELGRQVDRLRFFPGRWREKFKRWLESKNLLNQLI